VSDRRSIKALKGQENRALLAPAEAASHRDDRRRLLPLVGEFAVLGDLPVLFVVLGQVRPESPDRSAARGWPIRSSPRPRRADKRVERFGSVEAGPGGAQVKVGH
jgi:hypothetical protein